MSEELQKTQVLTQLAWSSSKGQKSWKRPDYSLNCHGPEGGVTQAAKEMSIYPTEKTPEYLPNWQKTPEYLPNWHKTPEYIANWHKTLKYLPNWQKT